MEKNRTMPHFFCRVERKICFNFSNIIYNYTKIKTNIYPSTVTKLVQGINHFLMYYWIYDRQEYLKICRYFFEKFIQLRNDSEEIQRAGEDLISHQGELIQKYCTLDYQIIDWLCRYVSAITINDINKRDSSTSITLDNRDCNVITVAGTAVKIAFIYTGSLCQTLRFDEAIPLFLDEIIRKVIERAPKYFDFKDEETGEIPTSDEIHSHIDSFIYGRIDTLWDKNSTYSFRSKFEEIGRNTLFYQSKNKISSFSSLRQYVPQLLNEGLLPKYTNDPSLKLKDIYWTEEKDFDDFKFINKNVAAYLQATLEEITKRQDTRSQITNVNTPDFLNDSSDERSVRKDVALYEDKTKHLFELRKTTVTKLFKMFVDEILRIIDETGMNEIDKQKLLKSMKIGKEHALNQFILTKMLLCLTGESIIYRKVLGQFSKILLLLFYVKVKYAKELDWLAPYIDAMYMRPTVFADENIEDIEAYLIKEGYAHIEPAIFASMCKIYTGDDGRQIKIKRETLLDLYDFLSDPSVVRHLLFPNIYKVEEIDSNVNKYKSKHKCFDEDEETKKNLAYVLGEVI